MYRSQAWGDVFATDRGAGGLGGVLDNRTSQSFARGAVHAREGAGGLAGASDMIEDSWCDGPVSTVEGGASGLVHLPRDGQPIERCWTASRVSTDAGAVASISTHPFEGAIFSSIAVLSQGADPFVDPALEVLEDIVMVSSEALASPATFTAIGWDFDEVWTMSSVGGITAPDLRLNPRPAQAPTP